MVPPAAPWVVDADGHISEPHDLWARYLPSPLRERASAALRMVDHPGGGVSACLEGRFIGEGNFQGAGGFGRTNAEMSRARWGPTDMNPGGFDPHRRLQDMDRMGIAVAVLFPSMCLLLNGVEDPELAAAMARAYNTYAAEFCGEDPRRLVPAAIVPLQSVAHAVDVMEHAAKLGHRAAALRPNLVRGRALHQPYYERLWQAAQDLDLAVALHPAATPEVQGSYEVIVWPDPQSANMLADALSLPVDCMITLAWLMFVGTLDRHPKVRIAILEASGSWVTMFLERLDKRVKHVGGPGGGRYPHIKSLPSDIFARQCFVAFESEEKALPRFADVLGDQMIWGSDYPHFDGEGAFEATENLASVAASIRRKILGENAARLYGLERP